MYKKLQENIPGIKKEAEIYFQIISEIGSILCIKF